MNHRCTDQPLDCSVLFYYVFFSSGLLLLSRVSHTKPDIKHWSVMCVSTAFHSNTVCTTGDVLSYSSAWTGDFVVANTISLPKRQYDSHHNHRDTIDCTLAQCQGHFYLFSYLFQLKPNCCTHKEWTCNSFLTLRCKTPLWLQKKINKQTNYTFGCEIISGVGPSSFCLTSHTVLIWWISFLMLWGRNWIFSCRW